MTDPLQQPESSLQPGAETAESADDSGSAASQAPASDMLRRVTDLYFLTEDKRTGDDTNAFGLVLEHMAYAAAIEQRADLANRLSFAKDAPVRLMRRMAFDTITVARPVLQYSPSLSDDDLEILAKKLGQDHLLALAHRLYLPIRVTDVLVRRGESPVRITVTNNAGAQFSQEAIIQLMAFAESDPELKFAIGLRPDISPPLFERFRSFVVGQFFVEVGNDTPEDAAAADQPAEPEAEAAEDGDAAGTRGRGGNDTGSAADDSKSVRATEGRLVELASSGNVADTIVCMAALTGLDKHMIEHCLLKAELSALMVLCKAHDFANGTFCALLEIRKRGTDDAEIDTLAMLKRYEAMQTHTAKRIIQYADPKKS